MNSQDVAIAFLMSEQEKENLRAMFGTSRVSRASKPAGEKKPRKVKAAKEQAEKPKAIAPTMMFLVEPGSVGPEGFLKLLRSAKSRQESMEAIHAYCGYDCAGDFGTQEYRAKAQAQREIRPIVVGAKMSAESTLRGYVAGMPDTRNKRFSDLKARERGSVETIITHQRTADETSDSMTRTLHEGLVQVEAERLQAIRLDLRNAR